LGEQYRSLSSSLLYIIFIKTFKIIKVASTCFGLNKPSSGSYSLRFAKVTKLIPIYNLYIGINMMMVYVNRNIYGANIIVLNVIRF